ncbi:MAG: SWIM zinc finger family protein [Ktedonobacteraceae bacterium]
MSKWHDKYHNFDDDDDWDDEDEDDDDDFDEYGNWNYYRENRPRKVAHGLKTKSERGAIGETWWSKRWVVVLESFGMGTRLTRGRSYARQGQVVSIDVEPGIIKAKVQGSRPKPYDVKIKLQPLSDKDWGNVTDAMAAQAIFAAKLLAGEMPTNIEEAFATAKVSLFPTSKQELVTECSCPDWANPCKHIAAVYYILAERFDEDPFLIFKLRGRSKEEIIQTLRSKRAETMPLEASVTNPPELETGTEDAPLLAENPSTFWLAGEALATFTVRPVAPAVEKALLKRLGAAPFNIANQNIASLLGKAYDVVDVAARRKMMGEDA